MNPHIFALLWPLSLVTPASLFGLSLRPLFGTLSGSALHPYNMLGFSLTITALDFFYIHLQISAGNSVHFAQYTIAHHEEIWSGFLFLLLMSASILLGIAAAHLFQKSTTVSKLRDKNEHARLEIIVLLLATGITALATGQAILQSLSTGSLFEVANTRQVFFRQHLLLQIFYASIVPSFIIFIAHSVHRPKMATLFFFIVLLLLTPLGSRGLIFYILIAVATAAAVVWQRLQIFWLYIIAPVVLPFFIFARHLRENITPSFLTYLELRRGELLLGGADFATADAIIVGVNSNFMPRYPFESLVGMIFAPVPRAIIDWKPEGASAAFSRLADPTRWETVKSEWLITSFVNLRIELGITGAAILLVLIAMIWSHLLIRACATDRQNLIVTTIFLTISAYILVRADLYNLALFLWPSLVVYALFSVLKSRKQTRR